MVGTSLEAQKGQDANKDDINDNNDVKQDANKDDDGGNNIMLIISIFGATCAVVLFLIYKKIYKKEKRFFTFSETINPFKQTQIEYH